MVEIIQSYQSGVENLFVQDRTFARVFSKWILQPKSQHVRRSMAVGYANEPVMLSKLPSFLSEEAGAPIALFGLAKFGPIVQSNRQWLGTSPDAVSLIVDSEDRRLDDDDDYTFVTPPAQYHVLVNIRNNRSKFIEISKTSTV